MTHNNNSPRPIKSLLAASVVLIGLGLYSTLDNTTVRPDGEPSAAQTAPMHIPGTRETEEGVDFDPEMKQRMLELSAAYEDQIA